MKLRRLLPGICLFALNVHAQNFSLMKDINTSKDGNPVNSINNLYISYKDIFYSSSSPYNGSFATLNGIAYFTADDGVHGTELWRSDNTTGGTYMVKDLTPGAGSSNIQNITATSNKLFFTATQVVYSSNGTDAGTMPVPGIIYNGDVTTCLTPVGNTLYFFTAVSKLWKTDGTQAGTSLIIDFRQVYNYTTDWLGQLTYVNGTLFFTTGWDNDHGPELWKSDGTAAGTAMVKDINPGSLASRPSNLTAVNGKLYFSADDGTGITLWVSDGTFNGTQPVVNNSGVSLTQIKYQQYQQNLDITPFPVINKVFYFKGFTADKGSELYKYNLNKPADGITLVNDIVQGTPGSDPSNLTVVNNTLYFSVSDAAKHQQLWKSDGTKTGTVLVKNMGAGSPTYFSNFAASNGLLLFSFYKASSGTELWSSDGTLAGTSIVKDIYAGDHSSSPASFTYFGNNISLFSAKNSAKGIELWRTDGTSAGTTIIKDLNNTATTNSNPDVYNPVTLNNKFYFIAIDNDGSNLYISNGTSAGTHLIKGVNQSFSPDPGGLTVFKNAVYFTADSNGYRSIYKTDGTDAGTIQVFNPHKSNLSVLSAGIVAAKDYLYVFLHETDSSYTELWALNGASGSWQKVQDIYASVSYPATLGNTLFFAGTDAAHGAELWKATYNPGSAQLLKDIYPGVNSSSPYAFITYNSKMYFKVYDGSNTSYIYSSDGTAQGTKRLYPGSDPIMQAGGKLYFRSSNANVGTELFVSDGTTNGTKLLKDIYPGTGDSNPGYFTGFTAIDSILYFSAYDNNNGGELWKTNGTKKGTVLVKDIWPGTSSSNPYRLTSAGGKLYFIANIDDTNKPALFVSDGTKAGTKQVVDAGLNDVTFYNIKGSGNKLYINGYTYAYGSELYAGISPGFTSAANNSAAKRIASNTLSAAILGNPVQNVLSLAVNNNKTQQVNIMITDASGKMLVNNKQLLGKGSNNISYATNTWPSGVYTLKVTAGDASPVLLKFVK